jgi:hypothetical protein
VFTDENYWDAMASRAAFLGHEEHLGSPPDPDRVLMVGRKTMAPIITAITAKRINSHIY